MTNDYLYINSRDELLRLDCSKIVYIEGDGNYTNIIMKNKLKTSVCMNLSEMQRLISLSLRERASVFMRIGKRYIINAKTIYRIHTLQQILTLSDGENFIFQLRVSKDALRQLKTLMLENAKSNKTE